MNADLGQRHQSEQRLVQQIEQLKLELDKFKRPDSKSKYSEHSPPVYEGVRQHGIAATDRDKDELIQKLRKQLIHRQDEKAPAKPSQGLEDERVKSMQSIINQMKLDMQLKDMEISRLAEHGRSSVKQTRDEME